MYKHIEDISVEKKSGNCGSKFENFDVKEFV